MKISDIIVVVAALGWIGLVVSIAVGVAIALWRCILGG